MDRDEAKEIVRETLREMGMDPEEFLETQDDMAYLRRMRKGSEQTALWIRRSLIGAFFSGIAWVAYEVIKNALGWR